MLPYLLPIIPSETISSYSRSVMVFSDSGVLPHSLESEGQKIGGAIMHSVAVSLERFCEVTENKLGAPEYLLVHHTEYPYYAAACSFEASKSLAKRIISGPSLRLHLPRLRSPIELERTPQLFCPICRQAHLDEYCRTGQLTTDVLPLAKVCSLHGETFFEELPSGPKAVLIGRGDEYRRAAKRFAEMSSRLLTLSTPAAVLEFRREMRDQLCASGYLRESGMLRASQLDDAMQRYYSGSSFDIRLRQLATASQRASRSARKLIGAQARSQHPVLVVLLAMFLEDEGASPISVRTSIPQCDFDAWYPVEASSSACGRGHRRRTEYGSRIEQLLAKGFSPKRTAALLHIRVDRVYYQIRRDGLRDALTECRLERDTPKRRQQWLTALDRWHDLPKEGVRGKVPALYRWLYRHDRTWLLQHGTGVRTWKSGSKGHARPYGADAKLASRITAIGHTTRMKAPPRRCTRRVLVVESGLTEGAFQRALRWKRVALAVASAEESRVDYLYRKTRYQLSNNETLTSSLTV